MDRKKLPFLIDTSSELAKWRAESFYTKEPETIRWIEFWTKSNASVMLLDVGANIGVYSLFAASESTNCLVFACEPLQENLLELHKNIALNSFGPNIKVHEVALGRRGAEAIGNLIIGDTRPGASGAQLSDLTVGNRRNVTVSTGDQLLSNVDSEVIIVKIDTDGNELDVLDGLTTQLRMKTIRSILVECSDETIEPVDQLLTNFGYVLKTDDVGPHSDDRRIGMGKVERNRIYEISLQ